MMQISREEQQAIQEVIHLGKQFGFGNLISHLKTAWAKLLIDEGMDERDAFQHSDRRPCYRIEMQKDLLENGEWDETGKKYLEKNKWA